MDRRNLLSCSYKKTIRSVNLKRLEFKVWRQHYVTWCEYMKFHSSYVTTARCFDSPNTKRDIYYKEYDEFYHKELWMYEIICELKSCNNLSIALRCDVNDSVLIKLHNCSKNEISLWYVFYWWISIDTLYSFRCHETCL